MAKAKVSIDQSFAGANLAAEKVAEATAARMVTLVAEETKANIRNLITRSIREGVSPYDTARAIRPMIGLNQQQGQAAWNYRKSLIDAGNSLEKVNSLTDRYAAKKLRERALTIARTETMEAINTGQRTEWRSAQRTGLLGPKAEREWMTVDNACPICLPMDGVRVLLDGGSFPVPGPPAHQRCRCTEGIKP